MVSACGSRPGSSGFSGGTGFWTNTNSRQKAIKAITAAALSLLFLSRSLLKAPVLSEIKHKKRTCCYVRFS